MGVVHSNLILASAGYQVVLPSVSVRLRPFLRVGFVHLGSVPWFPCGSFRALVPFVLLRFCLRRFGFSSCRRGLCSPPDHPVSTEVACLTEVEYSIYCAA